MGAPTKLTAELARKIVRLIATTACSAEAAAAKCGVPRTTFFRWQQMGREGIEPYRDFWDLLKGAKAESEATLAGKVAKAANEDWRAAAWILERRFHDRYGNRVTVVKKLEAMTDDELDEYIAGRLGQVALGPEGGDSDSDGAGGGAAVYN